MFAFTEEKVIEKTKTKMKSNNLITKIRAFLVT